MHVVRNLRSWLAGIVAGPAANPRWEASRDLAELAQRFDQVAVPHVIEGVAGWLSPAESRALYALGRWCRGPFLEIGPWVGLSTTLIALGVRDSGDAKPFTTVELNPAEASFRLHDGWASFHYPPDNPEPLCRTPEEVYRAGIEPVLREPGGILSVLERNLTRHGVRQLVEIRVGDFRALPTRRFGFVFADVMHTPAEIHRNATDLRRFVRRGTVLACHDTGAVNEAVLREYFRFRRSFQVDTLFVAEAA